MVGFVIPKVKRGDMEVEEAEEAEGYGGGGLMSLCSEVGPTWYRGGGGST